MSDFTKTFPHSKPLLTLAFMAVLPGAALAAPAAVNETNWEFAGEARIAERDGRAAIHIGPGPGLPLKGGQAQLKGTDFSTGTIEFDLLIDADRDFVGPTFRASADGNAEVFYIRPHMNAKPDSNQYTPVTYGNLGWQIFSGPDYGSNVNFPLGKWMRVRLEIHPTSMRVSVDGEPVLSVAHLKGANPSGAVGFTGAGSAYIANIDVTPIAGYPDPEQRAPEPPLPAGSVKKWAVSAPLKADDAYARAARRDWRGLKWNTVASESNGIANLSLAGPDEGENDTFIARFTLTSPKRRTVPLDFGFSDRVRVYLNGRPIYAGADLQGSRDYRFLGTVGFWDTLFLPLEPGANEVVFVVSDRTNGGTAAAARTDPKDAALLGK